MVAWKAQEIEGIGVAEQTFRKGVTIVPTLLTLLALMNRVLEYTSP